MPDTRALLSAWCGDCGTITVWDIMECEEGTALMLDPSDLDIVKVKARKYIAVCSERSLDDAVQADKPTERARQIVADGFTMVAAHLRRKPAPKDGEE